MKRLAILILLFLAPGCASPDRDYVVEIDTWHAARVAALRRDTGVLTQVGLYPLEQGTQSLGSAPDRDVVLPASAPRHLGLITIGAGIMFAADARATVEIFDRQPPERVENYALFTDAAGAPTVLVSGSLLLHVVERGGALFLRVRDRNSPAPREFRGVDRYPVDERWRVTAVLVDVGAGTLAIPNVLGQITTSPSPGTLEFELDGVPLQLRPTSGSDGSLFIVFGDATTGTETYPGGRFLRTEPVAADGRVVLDFNRAYNPVCAFNAYSTCPLPPHGNTLPVKVRAGEKYREH